MAGASRRHLKTLGATVRSAVQTARGRLPEWLGGRGPFVGVYPEFDAVPVTSRDHAGDNWVQLCLAEATRLRDTDALDAWQNKSRELEPIAVAIMATDEAVRVVDFGGAIGFSYLLLKRRLDASVRVEYHVVDTPQICAAGRDFFAGDPAIRFHEDTGFLDELPPGGLLTIANALQYVADWRSELASLLRYRPAYVLLTQLTAGEAEGYATLQRNIPGATLAHWIFSEQAVVDVVEGMAYSLVYRGRCQNDLNQIHHPKALRIGQFRNLLFRATRG